MVSAESYSCALWSLPCVTLLCIVVSSFTISFQPFDLVCSFASFFSSFETWKCSQTKNYCCKRLSRDGIVCFRTSAIQPVFACCSLLLLCLLVWVFSPLAVCMATRGNIFLVAIDCLTRRLFGFLCAVSCVKVVLKMTFSPFHECFFFRWWSFSSLLLFWSVPWRSNTRWCSFIFSRYVMGLSCT